jgi:hypothetical protein
MYKVILGLVIVALIAGAAYWYYHSHSQKERYSNIGDVDNVGSIDTQYELVPAAEMDAPAAHFADLVDGGDHLDLVTQPKDVSDDIRPMARLDRIQGSQLLPRVAAQVTPYNVDVADPATHLFSVNAPRVQLKNRLANQADFYRGDIPITYYENVALIGKSSYGRDSQKLDGFMSDHFRHLYNKYTGKAYLNMPIKVSNGETLMDVVN